MTMSVLNVGEKAVVITSLSLLWKEQRLFFAKGWTGKKDIPFEITPGNVVLLDMPIQSLVHDLIQQGETGNQTVRACFRSALGKDFKSNKCKINFDKPAKSKEPD